MRLIFPKNFLFGTSTSAAQIETAYQHDWQGIISRDGYTFDKTTDHEQTYPEDVDIIASLAPNYRMSVMWSRLQHEPFAPLDDEGKRYYHDLFSRLQSAKVSIMLVLFHWVSPSWFAQRGGWLRKDAVAVWMDFAIKMVDEFGHLVAIWNTFNEPNLYVTFSYALGEFPPFKSNFLSSIKVSQHLAEAHNAIFRYIKKKYPKAMVGVSINTAAFVHENIFGAVPSALARFWYHQLLPDYFKKCDYVGLSYYAKIRFDPFPLSNIYTPRKIVNKKILADDIWELYPEGISENIKYFFERYAKPIIITENGVCTSNDALRVEMIKKYMKAIHKCITDGIPVVGYYHWSTWDNFEWTLGPKFRFGLYEYNLATGKKTKKPSADVFAGLAYSREIDIQENL